MNALPVSSAWRFCLASVLLVSCVACQPQEEISTYTVERTSAPREPFVAAEVADQLDRTLAAMLPVGDTVYFFKLAAKAPAVERHRDAFNEFIAGVSKGDSETKPLNWKLPAGWTEKGPSEMRLETVVIPDEVGDIEIAISTLPMSGSWEDFVAANVNRWLGQLSQGELPRQTILNLTKEVKTPAGLATVIELAGVMKDTMPMNPHGGSAAKPTATKPPAAVEPPAKSTSSAITYEAPASWKQGPASPMREATYFVGDNDKPAEFTLSGWPAGATQMTDVTANVQRWAAQVGLPIDDKLAGLIEKTEIGGTEGNYVKLVGPEDATPRQAMLAAMVVRGEKVWFFKLTGDSAVVEKEADNFSKFLASVRFK